MFHNMFGSDPGANVVNVLISTKNFHGLALPCNCNVYKCSAGTSGGSKSVAWERVGKEGRNKRAQGDLTHRISLCDNFDHQQYPSPITELQLHEEGKES